MARIEGVDLPRNKRIETALTYIYGIGLTRSQKILSDTGVNPDIRVRDLSDNDENLIRDYIAKNYTVEDEHQAPGRNWLLSWIPASPQSALPWSTNPHERSYCKRSEEDRCRTRPPSWSNQEVNLILGVRSIAGLGHPFPQRLPAIFAC